MNILYVITGLGLGGAEKVVIDLAEQMYFLGHNVKIAYLTGEISVKPAVKEIELVALNLNLTSDLLHASKQYRQLIKHFRPHVVHAHMIHANIFARLNRVICSVPKLICTSHSSNEGGFLRMFAYRVTNHLSDINTNVSKEASQALIAKGAFTNNDLITVYNGVNLNKFEKISNDLELDKSFLNFIAVGRFNDAKDYPNLIHAFALLKDNVQQQVKLTIVGDGEIRSEIESLIKNLDLKDSVILLGVREDIPLLLSQADIFVLSSKYEGLPTVVIEAMACECYVVSTDCGGSAEILGDTGKLVPIKDSQALADALKEVIALDAKHRMQNNKKGRVRVEQLFSLKAAVKQWLKLYKEN